MALEHLPSTAAALCSPLLPEDVLLWWSLDLLQWQRTPPPAVAVIEGGAGTGKTFMLGRLARAISTTSRTAAPVESSSGHRTLICLTPASLALECPYDRVRGVERVCAAILLPFCRDTCPTARAWLLVDDAHALFPPIAHSRSSRGHSSALTRVLLSFLRACAAVNARRGTDAIKVVITCSATAALHPTLASALAPSLTALSVRLGVRGYTEDAPRHATHAARAAMMTQALRDAGAALDDEALKYIGTTAVLACDGFIAADYAAVAARVCHDAAGRVPLCDALLQRLKAHTPALLRKSGGAVGAPTSGNRHSRHDDSTRIVLHPLATWRSSPAAELQVGEPAASIHPLREGPLDRALPSDVSALLRMCNGVTEVHDYTPAEPVDASPVTLAARVAAALSNTLADTLTRTHSSAWSQGAAASSESTTDPSAHLCMAEDAYIRVDGSGRDAAVDGADASEFVSAEAPGCEPAAEINIFGAEAAYHAIKRALSSDHSDSSAAAVCVMLYGPSGVGKTSLARMCAGALGGRFLHLPLHSVLNSAVGVSERVIARAVAYASVCAPSVIFLDEVQALTQARRGGDSDMHDKMNDALTTQLLLSIDAAKAKQHRSSSSVATPQLINLSVPSVAMCRCTPSCVDAASCEHAQQMHAPTCSSVVLDGPTVACTCALPTLYDPQAYVAAARSFADTRSDVAAAAPRVLILMATNVPESLDPALLARCDACVHVPLPHASARARHVMHVLQSVRAHDTASHGAEHDAACDGGPACVCVCGVCVAAAATCPHGHSAVCPRCTAAVTAAAASTEGCSGADIAAISRMVITSALLRTLSDPSIEADAVEQHVQVTLEDVDAALKQLTPSVHPQRAQELAAWSPDVRRRANVHVPIEEV